MSNQAEVTVVPASQATVEVFGSGTPTVLEVSVAGPQGPQGLPGVAANLDAVSDVDASSKVDRSLLYYDAGTNTFKADATVTTSTLTDGGNF